MFTLLIVNSTGRVSGQTQSQSNNEDPDNALRQYYADPYLNGAPPPTIRPTGTNGGGRQYYADPYLNGAPPPTIRPTGTNGGGR